MYRSMFQETIRALAAIDAALGMPDDGCNSPERTITAIKMLLSAHEDDVAEIERLRSRLADLEAERALIIQRAENAEAALVEAKALRETRAKELSYVVEACTAALVIRTTHESRDALRDLRAWATNRIDAHLAEDA